MFFGKICFHNRAMHSNWRTSTGYMRQQFRIIIFYKFHPGRTAGSKLRQHPAGSYTMYQLCGFFGDGQVSREVDIQSIVEPRFFHRRCQFFFYPCTGWHTKFFTQPYTCGRRWLCSNNIFRVVDGSEHFVNLAAFMDGTCRTPQGTLPQCTQIKSSYTGSS